MSPALELRGQVFLEWGSVDGLERGGVSDGGGLGWRVESVWLSLPLTYSCSLASAVCPILLLTPFRVETQTGFCYVVQQCRGLQPYDCV